MTLFLRASTQPHLIVSAPAQVGAAAAVEAAGLETIPATSTSILYGGASAIDIGTEGAFDAKFMMHKWFMLGSLWLSQASNMLAQSFFGALLPVMLSQQPPQPLTLTQVAFVLSISKTVATPFVMILGWLADLLGAQQIYVLSSLVSFAGFLLFSLPFASASVENSYWYLSATWSLTLIGQEGLWPSLTKIVSRWIRPSTESGTTMSCMSLSLLVGDILARGVLLLLLWYYNMQWRWIAFISACLNLPSLVVVLFGRSSPRLIARWSPEREIIRPRVGSHAQLTEEQEEQKALLESPLAYFANRFLAGLFVQPSVLLAGAQHAALSFARYFVLDFMVLYFSNMMRLPIVQCILLSMLFPLSACVSSVLFGISYDSTTTRLRKLLAALGFEFLASLAALGLLLVHILLLTPAAAIDPDTSSVIARLDLLLVPVVLFMALGFLVTAPWTMQPGAHAVRYGGDTVAITSAFYCTFGAIGSAASSIYAYIIFSRRKDSTADTWYYLFCGLLGACVLSVVLRILLVSIELTRYIRERASHRTYIRM